METRTDDNTPESHADDAQPNTTLVLKNTGGESFDNNSTIPRTPHDSDKEGNDESDDELLQSFKQIRKQEKAKVNSEINDYKREILKLKNEHNEEVKHMEKDFEEAIKQHKQKIEEQGRKIAELEKKVKKCFCYECGKDVDSLFFCSQNCRETHIR